MRRTDSRETNVHNVYVYCYSDTESKVAKQIAIVEGDKQKCRGAFIHENGRSLYAEYEGIEGEM